MKNSADHRSLPMTRSSLNELSGLLWREREVLDQIVTRIGDGAEAGEYEGLLSSISSLELHRAITTREAAIELGFDGEPTLQDIVAHAPGEWPGLLADHRRALLALVDDLRYLTRPVAPEAASEHASNVVTLPDSQRTRVQRSLQDFLT